MRNNRGRSRSRSRGRGGAERAKQQQADTKRLEQEQAEEVKRLGRDGVRDLLTTTLESLYKDQMKPEGKYVKGRLKENKAPELLQRSYIEQYKKHPDLFRVEKQAGEGEDPLIWLVEEPVWFKGWVQMDDTSDDHYDADMWQALETYLEEGRTFGGGRYGMSRDLAAKKLDFLEPYSLGEICQIVQIAIERKLVVYHKKTLKSLAAAMAGNIPSEKNDDGEEEIGDMDQLLRVTFRMLKKHKQGVRLDRLKMQFREECSCKLNEMVFGCTKLIDVFRMEPLASAFNLVNEAKFISLQRKDPSEFPDEVREVYDEVWGQ